MAEVPESAVNHAPPSASSGNEFVLPPKNDALKKEEEAALHGADLLVKLSLPDGKQESLSVKSSTEVGYVKLLLAQKLQRPASDVRKFTLLLDGKPMIDPMSLCDYSGMTYPTTNVEVHIQQ